VTLSPRETEVARLIAAGVTDKQICARLGISHQRVSQVVSRLALLWGLDRSRNLRVQIATYLSKGGLATG